MKEKNIYVKPSKLSGTVKVSGAKNSVLRLMAATILFDKDIVLENYPKELLDVGIHEGMLKALGKKISVNEEDTVRITQDGPLLTTLDWKGRSIRNTLLILGALVTKYGYGRVPLPGGCKLGERKYDIHVDVMEALGAEVFEEEGFLVAKSIDKGLHGADIHLRMRSTGATENAILMGALAKGKTVIYNPHIRPEIIDLGDFLNKAGAQITFFGQERIEIVGIDSLNSISHRVMPDNMEALTWAVIAAVTSSSISIENFPFDDLEVPLIHLRESGLKLFRHGSDAIVCDSNCYPIDICTGPYPAINSDMQPLFAAFSAIANGNSHIVDLRFPGRYGYAEEMKKMGVKTHVSGDLLTIFGGSDLVPSEVRALDLRAGIALLILGLANKRSGEPTVILDSWQIKRGYNQIMKKLISLGANVEEK